MKEVGSKIRQWREFPAIDSGPSSSPGNDTEKSLLLQAQLFQLKNPADYRLSFVKEWVRENERIRGRGSTTPSSLAWLDEREDLVTLGEGKDDFFTERIVTELVAPMMSYYSPKQRRKGVRDEFKRQVLFSRLNQFGAARGGSRKFEHSTRGVSSAPKDNESSTEHGVHLGVTSSQRVNLRLALHSDCGRAAGFHHGLLCGLHLLPEHPDAGATNRNFHRGCGFCISSGRLHWHKSWLGLVNVDCLASCIWNDVQVTARQNMQCNAMQCSKACPEARVRGKVRQEGCPAE